MFFRIEQGRSRVMLLGTGVIDVASDAVASVADSLVNQAYPAFVSVFLQIC
jgi:hypothetical protein